MNDDEKNEDYVRAGNTDLYSTDRKKIKHYSGMMAVSVILFAISRAIVKFSEVDLYKLAALGVSILGVLVAAHYRFKIGTHKCSNCDKEFMGYQWNTLDINVRKLQCKFCG